MAKGKIQPKLHKEGKGRPGLGRRPGPRGRAIQRASDSCHKELSLQQGMRAEHTPGQRPHKANPFQHQEGGSLTDGNPIWPSKYLDKLEKKGMELRGQGMPRKKAHFNKRWHSLLCYQGLQEAVRRLTLHVNSGLGMQVSTS